jgi:CBS domain containing-hemolysin-like protein
MLGVGLIAIVGLVLANAFFVLSEFALITVDRARLEQKAEAGDKRARALLAATGQLTRNLSAAQFGITLSSLLIGFVAEPLVAGVIHPLVRGLPLLEEDLALGISIALALLISTYLQLVLGEQVPKGIAIAKPMATGLFVIGPLRAFAWAFGPPVRLLNGFADAVVRRLGLQPRSELTAARSIEELEVVIRESGARGTLSKETARLLSRAIKFGGRTALDAMTPRPQLVTVGRSSTASAMLIAAGRSGHTGMPVQGTNAEEVVGVVRVEDALALTREERKRTHVSAITRETLAVPESKDLLSLIREMRAQHIQLVTVIDEYGGLAGIVTDEDILEEIVGEIDEGRPGVAAAREPGLLPGWAHDDQVLEESGFTMPEGEGAYETLAGFLLSLFGHIPAAGERIVAEEWTFEVAEMDEHRIAWVRIRPPANQARDEEGPP